MQKSQGDGSDEPKSSQKVAGEEALARRTIGGCGCSSSSLTAIENTKERNNTSMLARSGIPNFTSEIKFMVRCQPATSIPL